MSAEKKAPAPLPSTPLHLPAPVEQLRRFRESLTDEAPCIQAPSVAISYGAAPAASPTRPHHNPTNFLDSKALDHPYREELEAVSKLNLVIRRGGEVVFMCYAYRSLARSLPQVQEGDSAERKTEIYRKSYEVIEPEIRKMSELYHFHLDAIRILVSQVELLLKPERRKVIIPEVWLLRISSVIDILLQLDHLKNIKAALNNDFSFYRRLFHNVRADIPGSEQRAEENHALYLFLANNSSIMNATKEALEKVSGYEYIVVSMLNAAMDALEEGRHRLPAEKHVLQRTVATMLFLADRQDNSVFKSYKDKRFRLERYAKYIKMHPVCPVFGDVQVRLAFDIVARCPNYVEADHLSMFGTKKPDVKLAPVYELVHHATGARAEHNRIAVALTQVVQEVRHYADARVELPQGLGAKMNQVVAEGLRQLSAWTAKVLESCAWKYSKPPDDSSKVSEGTAEYERLVRLNYSSQDRHALVEFISVIKSLAGTMRTSDALLAPYIRRQIHAEVQDFVQNSMSPMIRNAIKKKRSVAAGVLLQLRALVADWKSGVEVEVPKKKPAKAVATEFGSRAAGPTATQLHLLRSALAQLSDDDAPGMQGGIFADRDIKAKHVAEIRAFLDRSAHYEYLLDLTGSIDASSDLGGLWYREFYLDLGRCIQFPIDSSLPWILTSEVIYSPNPGHLESIFFPIDLYNDAAHTAVHVIGSRFLFEEIEAEANLVWDQLIFKLSDQLYTHYKVTASCMMLDKPFKRQLDTIVKGSRFVAPKSRWDVILRQRNVSFMGRSINLARLLGQRISGLVRANLDVALQKYEASDACSLVELSTLVDQIRLTHALASEHLSLDPFEDIFAIVDESSSLVSYHGRVVIHTVAELANDVFPNFVYCQTSQRMVRAQHSFREPLKRDAMPKLTSNYMYGTRSLNVAFGAVADLTGSFFGPPHVAALLDLVGLDAFSLILEEVLNHIHDKVELLDPYVNILLQGLPGSTKLPEFEYGTNGAFGYFSLLLKDLLVYGDIKSEVLQTFRDAGNAIVFVTLAETAVTTHETMRFIMSAPFLGIEPLADAKASDTNKYYYDKESALVSAVRSFGTLGTAAREPAALKDLVTSVERADRALRPSDANMSIFANALARIDQMLEPVRDVWSGNLTEIPEGSPFAVHDSREFYRIWSVLAFLMCQPSPPEELSNDELFGDSIAYSGMVFIHLLGQTGRFNTFDFAQHVARVESAQMKKCEDPAILAFLVNWRRWHEINTFVTSLCQAHAPREFKNNSLVFHPPKEIKKITHQTTLQAGAGAKAPAGSAAAGGAPKQAPAAPATSTPASTPAAPAPAPAAPAPAPPAPAPPAAPAAAPPAPPSGAPPPPPGGAPPPPPPGGAPPAPPPPGGAPPPPPSGGPPKPPAPPGGGGGGGAPPPPPPGGAPPPPPGGAPPPPPPGGAPPPPPPGGAPKPPPPPGGAPPPPPPPGGAPPPPPPPP